MHDLFAQLIPLDKLPQPQDRLQDKKSEIIMPPRPSVVIKVAGSSLILPIAVALECNQIDRKKSDLFCRPQILTSPYLPPATIRCWSKSRLHTLPSRPDHNVTPIAEYIVVYFLTLKTCEKSKRFPEWKQTSRSELLFSKTLNKI